MAETKPKEKKEKEEEKYTVTFSNGALVKLHELAEFLGTEKLTDVLSAGMKLLDIAKDNKIVKEGEDGKRYIIDVKEL
jgi:hypothetical protein